MYRDNARKKDTHLCLSILGLCLGLAGGCGSTDSNHAAGADAGGQADSQQSDTQQADSQHDPDQLPVDEIRSDKKRITSPAVGSDDLATQVAGNNAFALDFYQQVRTDPGNLIYSPHSISMALAMVHGGARSTTEQQLAKGMHFVLAQDVLHAAFNKLDLELESRGQNAAAADGKAFRLRVANASWGQIGHDFLPDYLDLLALHYGAGLQLLDFGQTEAARKTINDWVEQETESRIKELIPAGALSPITRFVLTNAIYFNAAWATSFDDKATADGAFNRLDGSSVTTPMMHGTQHATHAVGADYEAVALPYDGNELSMLVIVPKAGAFDSFEQSLDVSKVDAIVAQLSSKSVALTLPKFENTKPLDLNDSLKALGITDLFDDTKADLSGIDGTKQLYVSKVIHKAFIKVNEAGTEAAAATAVVMPPSAEPPATLVVDRPFIYLIRDHATGAILFVGRVVDPSV